MAEPTSERIDTLNLVTSPESPFYRTQVRSLRAQNVRTETRSVPGTTDGADAEDNRSPLDYLKFFPKTRRALSSEYDLIHANYGLTAPHALAQRRLPVVLSLWGTDVFGPYGWVSKLCAPYCDAVIVMSDRMGQELPCDYTVIPHGVDLDLFQPISRQEARAELGWDDDSYHVLFSAPIERAEKGYPRAKRVATLADEDLDEPVVLQAPNGAVPHERMPLWMNAADALLLTSKHEGSPNAVKEAMACNVPVVSTDVGDVAERLAEVEPSVVASTNRELAAGLAGILRRGDRSNGRQAAGHLGIDHLAGRIREVYDDVIAGVAN